jgi:hypothetical protein
MDILHNLKEWLKRKWLSRDLDQALRHRDRSGLNAKCHTLGVLIDESVVSEFDVLYDWYADLNMAPKDIKVFTYLEVKKKLPTLRQNQLTNTDFDWQGHIDNPGAIEFIDTPFDVLLALYEPGNKLLDLVVAKSKSKFKVGSQGLNQELFDLSLAVAPERLALMRSEFVKYMSILNKKL